MAFTSFRHFSGAIWALAICLSFGYFGIALGQGTIADYERANALPGLVGGKVLRGRLEVQWLPGQEGFYYRRETAPGKFAWTKVSLADGESGSLFDQAALATQLGKLAEQPVSAENLPLEKLQRGDDGQWYFTAFGKHWKWNDNDKSLQKEEKEHHHKPLRHQFGHEGGRHFARRGEESPDGKWKVVHKDHNLLLVNKSDNSEKPLTTDGTADKHYESGVFWSADSRRVVALLHAPPEQHRIPLVQSSPPDQVQPKVRWIDYLKPGDRIPQTWPRLFDIEKQQLLSTDESLYANPWSIDQYRWSPDGKEFTFVYNERGHAILRMVSLDSETGKATTKIEERPGTFVDYASKQFSFYNDAAGEILWMSERSGWNHLYLFDMTTGQLKNPITQGNWVVRRVLHVDAEKRQVWFTACGMTAEQDPYYMKYCRVNFDGTGLTELTPGDGTHEIHFSPTGEYYVDQYSRVDMPPVYELRRSGDGSLVKEFDRADWSALLATGWKTPIRFMAPGRDGTTPIYGVIYTPTNLDPAKVYPVIELIYAGPHDSFVPKRFSSYTSHQGMAEIGFIVVQIDGMGTNNRGKKFHDVCHKNLGDSGFPDRIAWMKKAAEAYPFMDLTRVGIFGGSAGGQSSTRAMLAHGDFYKVAVSDCGCHDNRMDKIWWNELWMGWPIGSHYHEQSNVTQAHRLQGKLMLTVGEVDSNVDPASTMQVVNALIKANKDFDLVVFPGGEHGSGESPYGNRRRRDFFVRHLWGVEPRSK